MTDASPLSSAGALADAFEIVPLVTDPHFVKQTLETAMRHDVDAIVPTIDPELAVFARARDEFLHNGVDVLVSSPEVTDLSWDKWMFYTWLEAHGLPTVSTFELSDTRWADLSSPIFAKPRSGSSSIGVFRAETPVDLSTSGLDGSYIVQSAASGVEITVDFAVAADGAFLGAVPRRRIEVRSGEVSKGVTVRSAIVEDVVRELVAQLPGPYGVLNVQLFYDPSTSDVAIIELNARAGGGYPLSDRAGARFFSALSSGSADPFVDWEEDLAMLRYDDAAFVKTNGFRISL